MQARPRIQSIHARREAGFTHESVTCQPVSGQGQRQHSPAGESLVPLIPDYCFVFAALICRIKRLISSGVSFPAYFGMRPFPLLMILRKSSAEVAATFSETSDGPPKCRPSPVLPWHLAQLFW